MWQVPSVVKGVEYFSMTGALKHFREMYERAAGTSIDKVQVNAAELLDEIAEHIGLSEARRDEVLGRSARHVRAVQNDHARRVS